MVFPFSGHPEVSQLGYDPFFNPTQAPIPTGIPDLLSYPNYDYNEGQVDPGFESFYNYGPTPVPQVGLEGLIQGQHFAQYLQNVGPDNGLAVPPFDVVAHGEGGLLLPDGEIDPLPSYGHGQPPSLYEPVPISPEPPLPSYQPALNFYDPPLPTYEPEGPIHGPPLPSYESPALLEDLPLPVYEHASPEPLLPTYGHQEPSLEAVAPDYQEPLPHGFLPQPYDPLDPLNVQYVNLGAPHSIEPQIPEVHHAGAPPVIDPGSFSYTFIQNENGQHLPLQSLVDTIEQNLPQLAPPPPPPGAVFQPEGPESKVLKFVKRHFFPNFKRFFFRP